MIHSVISYGINIYGCANKTTLEKLIVKQKQAIRTICNATYRAHTAPLFKQQKILPVEKLIEYSKIKFLHSFHFKKLPLSFANTWTTNFERNPERALVMPMIYLSCLIVLNLSNVFLFILFLWLGIRPRAKN